MKMIQFNLTDSDNLGRKIWVNVDHIVAVDEYSFSYRPATRITLSVGLARSKEQCLYVSESVEKIVERINDAGAPGSLK